ncbi:MAG: hypothetical protein EPN72_10590 [Nevskiaceae bacterium]|nr:MAG: hypothetical protein EPN63_05600 [Nevskiaceae bacterium]TBR72197.1 MAG: hypothetical protein EPN72_10590 [Nevskiaceae bacterium]
MKGDLATAADPAPAVRPWAPPTFDTPPTAETVERIEQQAWEAGDTRGYQDGLQRGTTEVAHRVAALDAVLAALAKPLAEQEAVLAESLRHAAWTLGEVLARTQLRYDPGTVAQLAREAVAALAAPTDTVTLQVAPAQYAALAAALQQSPPSQPWQLEANPALQPGDCKAVGLQATADATLDARLREVAEHLLEPAAEASHGDSNS